MKTYNNIRKLDNNYIVSSNERELISPSIFFFGLFILLVFYSNSRYLGITEYYYFPLVSITFSGLFLYKKKFKLSIEHFCIIFLLYILIFNLIRYQTSINSGVYISYFLYFLVFLFLTLKKVNRREIRFLVNSYILSAFIISLMIIIFRKELDGWVGTYRYTIKFTDHVYIDPNFIAAFIVTPIIFTLNRIFIVKKYRYMYIIITIIITAAVFLTGSRGAMIAMFLGIIFVLNQHIKGKKIFIGILLLIIFTLVLYNYLPDGTTQRMFYNSYSDESNTTRLLNWEVGLKAFLLNPILGYGPIDTSVILTNTFSYNHAVHNTYIAILNQFGLLGTIPFLIIILKILLKTIRKEMRILFGTLISLLFTSLMVEQNVAITFWVVLTLLYIINNFKKDNPNIKIVEII